MGFDSCRKLSHDLCMLLLFLFFLAFTTFRNVLSMYKRSCIHLPFFLRTYYYSCTKFWMLISTCTNTFSYTMLKTFHSNGNQVIGLCLLVISTLHYYFIRNSVHLFIIRLGMTPPFRHSLRCSVRFSNILIKILWLVSFMLNL